jgi:hypothetical protein
MKTTRYFREQVLRKRPYLDVSWCDAVVAAPLHRSIQPDGRMHYWGRVTDPRDGRERVLRVVTLEDGVTILNAFFDRGYREDPP